MSLSIKHTTPPKNSFLRIMSCIFLQKLKTISCPKIDNLVGKNVLITGGSSGVGEFISRKMIECGANVVSLSRGVSKSMSPIKGLESISTDLSRPESIVEAVNKLSGKKIDILICNAGILCDNYQEGPDGVEKTFSVNVLGHHILYRLLINRQMLSENARVILTTGDIYTIEKNCPTTHKPYSGPKVYASSKLGNLWQVFELAKRYPNLYPISVHPGVIASGFAVKSKNGFVAWLRKRMLITEEQGSQSSLIAATQNIQRGSYWHNVMGVVDLDPNDAALDSEKADKLWNRLEELTKCYL